ncbi:MAG TPA: serine hydrolase [Candidatus Acidoferrales bacterium]|nr:serine hydrolase [Candidatus Acidoferrales bacterium]
MKKVQFRVLYREFLFRIVDLELLSAHAQGDSRTLLGQFAALLVFCSLLLGGAALLWMAAVKDNRLPPLVFVIGAWTVEHFLIATTMLVVGVFAVLSWESTFPDRRDVLVLAPLPVPGRTVFLAKVAAVASALGLTVAAFHSVAGLTWPFALAQFDSAPAPALVFDPPLAPLRAADFPSVMDRDIAPMLRRLDLAAADGGAGIAIGISEHGRQRIMTYGAARPDSLFEIGSIGKTFTGLLLAQMAVHKDLDLQDPVRDLLPPGLAAAPKGFEITLLDLATHRSGLPRMPDNAGPPSRREAYTGYRTSDLYDYIKLHGLAKPPGTTFAYSNLGFAVLGAAMTQRAHTSYSVLLEREITGPLGMKDTVIMPSPEQNSRFLQGHDVHRLPTPRMDMDAFAAAGGIRSTAGDMLTYLEAQLHPERTPFRAALADSHLLRARVAGSMRIGLAWMYNPDTGFYQHGGATFGFTSDACFDPRRDVAAVVLLNAAPVTFPFIEVLGEHVRQRLSGEPALSLAPVSVPAAGPIRSFFAYWIAMAAAGAFVFCCVLGMQGVAAQLLPRRWFLRASAFLQLAVFCLLVTAYFLQRSPVSVLVTGPRQPWMSWVPSYWFLGVYQQLSGSLHPALEPFAWRAWIGLGVAVCATGVAYAASYLRTLRRIVEEPDIAPRFKNSWLPRFGGAFETAIAQFSVRSLLRSRQHRMIFAFYLGVGLAFAIFFLNAPRELAGPAAAEVAEPWHQPSVPLLASTIALMGLWVVGARVIFSFPLDLRANWIFRVLPFQAGPGCLRARRRALYTLSVAPAWAISAVFLLALWPWRPAAQHLAGLACLGIFLAEFSPAGVQKIPFTCSYLPGRSHINVTFLFWIYMLLTGIVGMAIGELDAFQRPAAIAGVLGALAFAALAAILRNNWMAHPGQAELRFEEEPPDRLVSLDLSWNGGAGPP